MTRDLLVLKEKDEELCSVNPNDCDDCSKRDGSDSGKYPYSSDLMVDINQTREYCSSELHENDEKPRMYRKVVRFFAIVFVTLEVHNSSSMARIFYFFFKAVIILAVLSYLISTEPSMREAPATCQFPACDDDPLLCPGFMICEKEKSAVFEIVDEFCIYIFTIEYGLRLLSCWAVSARVAGVLPRSWDQTHRPTDPEPKYSTIVQIIRFMSTLKNLVDLACILPFYVHLLMKEQNSFSKVNAFLRLIRILRLVDAFSFIDQIAVTTELIVETIRQAGPVLSVFLFFAFIAIILISGIIYVLEKGVFTVNSDYPLGQYLRLNLEQNGLQVSPYRSACVGIYWTIITCTTVGYGDVYPTTIAGRALACMCALLGIVGIAFPVGVLGSEFKRVFDVHNLQITNRVSEKKKQKGEQAKRESAAAKSRRAARRAMHEKETEKLQTPQTLDLGPESSRRINAGMKKIREMMKEIVDQNELVRRMTVSRLELIAEEMRAIDMQCGGTKQLSAQWCNSILNSNFNSPLTQIVYPSGWEGSKSSAISGGSSFNDDVRAKFSSRGKDAVGGGDATESDKYRDSERERNSDKDKERGNEKKEEDAKWGQKQSFGGRFKAIMKSKVRGDFKDTSRDKSEVKNPKNRAKGAPLTSNLPMHKGNVSDNSELSLSDGALEGRGQELQGMAILEARGVKPDEKPSSREGESGNVPGIGIGTGRWRKLSDPIVPSSYAHASPRTVLSSAGNSPHASPLPFLSSLPAQASFSPPPISPKLQISGEI